MHTMLPSSSKANVDIGATKAQVVFVIDRSGSMDRRYSSGVVQKIVDKMVPLGLTFDDDGSIVCMQFNSKVNMCDDINVSFLTKINDTLGQVHYTFTKLLFIFTKVDFTHDLIYKLLLRFLQID